MEQVLLLDLSIIIIAATVLAILAKLLKQPAILAYIIGGLAIGPFGLRLITDTELVQNIGEIGIALLLFVVGLELSIDRLRKVGAKATLIGLAEVLIIAGIGLLIALSFGFNYLEGVYIGLILAFSSTLVVVKLLSDKRELDTLHGRIMLGVLLVQDIIVIFAISILINSNFSFMAIGKTLVYGFGLLAIAMLMARYVLPLFFRKVAESAELLLLFSLSWCFVFAAVANLIGFSIVIGAFIAGLSLASFPYNFEIIGRVKPLRDFFVTIFFVTIGIQIIPTIDGSLVLPLIVFMVIALLLKPIIISAIVSRFQYTRRTAFLSGMGLAQTSEFSIILAMQGILLGHITNDLLSLVIIVTALTMLISTYFVKYNNKIYRRFAHIFLFYNKKKMSELDNTPKDLKNHIIVLGADRTGRRIINTLTELGKPAIIVDYNPEVIHSLMERGINCLCGDAEDTEILERLNTKEAYAVISTIPELEINKFIIKHIKKENYHVLFFSVADNTHDALVLYEMGADYVLVPQLLAGEKISDILRHFNKKEIIDILRIKQFNELERVRERELIEKHAPKLLKFKDGLRRYPK